MRKKIYIASWLIHALTLTAGLAATAFAQAVFWEPVNGSLVGPVRTIAVDRHDVIFAGTSLGVARSTDDGDSWEVDLPEIPVFALAINSAGHIFAGTLGSGVYRSTDQGETWNPVNDGLTNNAVFALTINSVQQLFAGTFDGGVFRSIDNGDTWESVNEGLTESFVTALASNSAGHLFAGTDTGVFRSTDNGDSWSYSSTGLPRRIFFSLAVNAADHIFAGTGESGIFRSTDNGNSWDEVNIGLNSPDIRALAINDAGDLFAGLFGINLDTGGVFRSLNNGDSWEAVNTGLTRLRVLALAIDRQGRILAGTDGDGVFRSIGTATGVDENAGSIPPSFTLVQNYPNPFNPTTTITYELPQSEFVNLSIYNAAGQLVETLVNEGKNAGVHSVQFSGRNLSTGLYYYRINAGEHTAVGKALLLK